ncbi:MAG: type IV pilus twitching motility protein PilT [Verrucomicrobiota bacterium]
MKQETYNFLANTPISFQAIAEIAKCDPSITDVFLAERRTMRVLSNRTWKTIQTAVPDTITLVRMIEDGKAAGALGRVQGVASRVGDFVVSLPRTNDTPLLLRGHPAKDRYGFTLSLRILNQVPLTLDSLGMRDIDFSRIVTENMRDGGLVLVCGPTSSGKSTTLAAMIEEYCRSVGGRVVTLEDPIEYPFNQPHHFVTQREVGVEVDSWEAGIFGSLRERIDLLMVGELRTAESIRAALQACQAGMFVIATIHVMRIKELVESVSLEFPAAEQENIRKKLSASLTMVISQRLLPGVEHSVLLYELLRVNSKSRAAIARGTPNDIEYVIQGGLTEGNMTFQKRLDELYDTGQIKPEVHSMWSSQRMPG